MCVSKNPFRLLKAALAQFSTAGSLISPLVVHPWLMSQFASPTYAHHPPHSV